MSNGVTLCRADTLDELAVKIAARYQTTVDKVEISYAPWYERWHVTLDRLALSGLHIAKREHGDYVWRLD